ncbi:hypothetical protein F383_30131 [Gossypium arboreum]|uniref:Uncharacterized protein n=1 Tax=Gossypium arboreum TaxID=29729 RepID=A0A0B0PIP8_GOSAR|nr:hypothetical protein F383_30131 [Gossypium arboreum]
MSSGVRIHK